MGMLEDDTCPGSMSPQYVDSGRLPMNTDVKCQIEKVVLNEIADFERSMPCSGTISCPRLAFSGNIEARIAVLCGGDMCPGEHEERPPRPAARLQSRKRRRRAPITR